MCMSRHMSNARIELALIAVAGLVSGCGSSSSVGNAMTASPPTGSPAALRRADAPATGAGIVTLRSANDFTGTVSRLRAAIGAKGLKIFAAIDHQANAKGAGLTMRPEMVELFGNPALGTPLMKARPTIGLDLPQRVLVYNDETGATWLAYNDPAWLAARHGVTGQDEAVGKIAAALRDFARAATQN